MALNDLRAKSWFQRTYGLIFGNSVPKGDGFRVLKTVTASMIMFLMACGAQGQTSHIGVKSAVDKHASDSVMAALVLSNRSSRVFLSFEIADGVRMPRPRDPEKSCRR
jgi:hypothetical protein